jgi:hypothetical protein
MTDYELLTAHGFIETGEYIFTGPDAHLTLTGRDQHPSTAGCYAFMDPDEPSTCVYVGCSKNGVGTRVWDYRQPHEDYPRAPRSQLWVVLSGGKRAKVLTLATEGWRAASGLHITAYGVARMTEESLIDALKPRFNSMGVKGRCQRPIGVVKRKLAA